MYRNTFSWKRPNNGLPSARVLRFLRSLLCHSVCYCGGLFPVCSQFWIRCHSTRPNYTHKLCGGAATLHYLIPPHIHPQHRPRIKVNHAHQTLFPPQPISRHGRPRQNASTVDDEKGQTQQGAAESAGPVDAACRSAVAAASPVCGAAIGDAASGSSIHALSFATAATPTTTPPTNNGRRTTNHVPGEAAAPTTTTGTPTTTITATTPIDPTTSANAAPTEHTGHCFWCHGRYAIPVSGKPRRESSECDFAVVVPCCVCAPSNTNNNIQHKHTHPRNRKCTIYNTHNRLIGTGLDCRVLSCNFICIPCLATSTLCHLFAYFVFQWVGVCVCVTV